MTTATMNMNIDKPGRNIIPFRIYRSRIPGLNIPFTYFSDDIPGNQHRASVNNFMGCYDFAIKYFYSLLIHIVILKKELIILT